MSTQGKIAIGYSDFQEIRERNFYYIDKSFLIEQVINTPSKVLLLPRPRRFGKTLNLSMLRYFFEKTAPSNRALFEGLVVSQNAEVLQQQGQYPVIYLTFKDVKEESWEICLQKMSILLTQEIQRHQPSLTAVSFNEQERQHGELLLKQQAPQALLENAIALLITMLRRATGQKVIVLIDEYDTPINAAWQYGYYEKIIPFIRNLFSAALKDNTDLEKGVLTGILRVAKESIFSGLNHLDVFSLLSPQFATSFGFTEPEVEQMLQDFKLTHRRQEVQNWYNGYLFGGSVIFNPWSVLQFVSKQPPVPQPYWVETSSNDLIRELILDGKVMQQEDLETLLDQGQVSAIIHDNVVLRDVAHKPESLWSLLVFSGYLKPLNSRPRGERIEYDLIIPNLEVKCFFSESVQDWLNHSLGSQPLQTLLKALVQEDWESFEDILQDLVAGVLSFHDTAGAEPEKVYHAFVLGLLVNLSDRYQVRSNRESGYGRHDVMLIPKEIAQTGFVFEFKKMRPKDGTPENALQSALKQLQEKAYATEIRRCGVQKVIGIAVVVEGKKVWLRQVLL